MLMITMCTINCMTKSRYQTCLYDVHKVYFYHSRRKHALNTNNIPIDAPGPIEITVVPLAFFSVRVEEESKDVLRAAGVGTAALLPVEGGALTEDATLFDEEISFVSSSLFNSRFSSFFGWIFFSVVILVITDVLCTAASDAGMYVIGISFPRGTFWVRRKISNAWFKLMFLIFSPFTFTM